MPNTATWHLITGSTGAGKSTLAHQLQADRTAIRFSIDDWMNTLFWPDCPARNDLAFALDRIARCEAQIAAVATQLAHAGIDAILDLGFTQREHRLAWLHRAQAAGIPCRLHVLDVPAETRWQRVCERTLAAAPPSPSPSPARCSTSWKPAGNAQTPRSAPSLLNAPISSGTAGEITLP